MLRKTIATLPVKNIKCCLLVILLFAWMGNGNLFAQNEKGKGKTSPGAVFDQVFDRFGNRYKLEDLRIPQQENQLKKQNQYTEQLTPFVRPVHLLCSTSGYFNLYFEDGSGFELLNPVHTARRDVVCQVFNDLSNFIVPVNPSTKVNIWVRDITHIVTYPNGSGVLGLASSFYTVPAVNPPSSGIADNQVWITINSGTDGYTNVTSPLVVQGSPPGSGAFYHGLMAFNFSDPLITWHTDLTTATASSDFDLYSVVLHEVTHSLGFASLIGANGNSLFGSSFPFYSRYDLFLKAPMGQNLITTSSSCSLYDYGFNSLLNAATTLSPVDTVCITDSTTCATAVVFAGSVNQPVYTPNCFEYGSSLSHLEDECHVSPAYANNQYYCMSNASGPGSSYMKRYLKPEERSVLCDIGYQVNTYYGNTLYGANNYTYSGGVCSGLNVAGINDGISGAGTYTWSTTTSSTVNIPGSGLLGNDYNADQFECLEVINGLGSVSTTSGNTSTTVTFTAGSTTGIALLRYIPVNSTSGNRGNITYAYVLISSAGCTPTACNMIMNDGFENVSGCGITSSPDNAAASCWDMLCNTPAYFARGCTATSNSDISVPTGSGICSPAADSWNGSPNNTFLGLGYYSAGPYGDAVQTLLASPMQPGISYTLGFWARSADNGSNISGSNRIMFRADTGPMAPITPGTYSSTSSYLTEVVVRGDNQWRFFSVTFISPATLGSLFIGNEGNSSGNDSYVFIDDLTLLPTNSTVKFEPFALCGTPTIPDLSVCVFPPMSAGSSFSGPGVSFSGGVYSFTAGSTGLYTLFYNYTNSSGCSVSIPAQFNVFPSAGPTITLHAWAPTPFPVCAGTNVILSATGADAYTWYNPPIFCSDTCDSVVVYPPVSTLYQCYGIDSNGCADTAEIWVNVSGCNGGGSPSNIVYEMPEDVKHYTTKIIPFSGDKSVMVGTIFSSSTFPGIGRVHFLRLDPNGSVVISKQYTSAYGDERAVDIQCFVDTSGLDTIIRWYITSQITGTGMIRVMCVDHDGNILDQRVFEHTTGALAGFVLHPMHSTLWTDGAGDNRLYICGYTTLPGQPQYDMPKSAFVIGININDFGTNNHLKFIPLQGGVYDWNTGWAPLPLYPNLDYDMAVRITQVKGTGLLWVTGSVNGLETQVGCPGCPWPPPARSATMNLVLDPDILLGIHAVVDDPFLQQNSMDDLNGPNDYGVDLIQVNGDRYILGNMATPSTEPYNPGDPNKMDYPRAWNYFYIQPVNNYFIHGGTRWYFWNVENHWAAHAMPMGSGSQVAIATLISNQYSTCIPLPQTPSYKNVNVDLMTVTLNPSSAPGVIANKLYMTSTETGDPMAGTNSFYDMGAGYTNIDYPPTFAAKGSFGFMVNAPKYMNGKLNLKCMTPDLASLSIPCGLWDCNAWPCTFGSYFVSDNVRNGAHHLVEDWYDVDWPVNPSFSSARPYSIASGKTCHDQNGNPSYKRAAATPQTGGNTPIKPHMYPNPTGSTVTVDLGKNIEPGAQINIRMQNMLGQDMGNLYQGLSFAQKKLALPDVPPGVYLVEIRVNDELVMKEKLMISK